MDPRLQRWLLSEEPLPDDVDLDALVEAELPGPPPPPGLFAATLAAVEATPQPRASFGERAPYDVTALPAPANRSWGAKLGGAVALLAAAAVAVVVALPGEAPVGDPADFVARGDATVTPEVDLFTAVRTADGAVDRVSRGASYAAGSTLVFRYDLERAALLHAASAGPGTADLQTQGAAVGYELEGGEKAAVFAIVSSERPLSAAQIADALSVGPDADAVCAAASALGAGCDAVAVGAVR